MRTRRAIFLTFIIAAVAVAASSSAAAQEKGKETKKPAATSTADAWRQALPPEAERESRADETAADTTARPSREETEQNLVALERKWMEALKLRDAGALAQIVSEDFTLVSPRLTVGDKSKYLDHALRELKVASYDFEELAVRLYGRTAVVSGRLRLSATAAGEDLGGSYLVTDVWISRNGVWQVVSRHESLSPDK